MDKIAEGSSGKRAPQNHSDQTLCKSLKRKEYHASYLKIIGTKYLEYAGETFLKNFWDSSRMKQPCLRKHTHELAILLVEQLPPEYFMLLLSSYVKDVIDSLISGFRLQYHLLTKDVEYILEY